MSPKKIFGIVLAGGEGKRLMPLTADRAKPAVPFAGGYRLIDFALSNLINSGLRQVVVLTQYKSHSLDRHVSQESRIGKLNGAQQGLGHRARDFGCDADRRSALQDGAMEQTARSRAAEQRAGADDHQIFSPGKDFFCESRNDGAAGCFNDQVRSSDQLRQR